MYQELCWLFYLHYIISSSYCPCELEVSLILHMRKLTWPKTHAKCWPIGNLPGLSSGCAGLHTSSSHARPGYLPEQSTLLHPSLICISTALFIMFSSILVHLGKTHSPLRLRSLLHLQWSFSALHSSSYTWSPSILSLLILAPAPATVCDVLLSHLSN